MAITTKEALELNGSDLKKLTRKEIADIVTVMNSTANKRIKRLEQAGQPISETVERFSVKGKNRNELLKEFTRVKQFLQSERMSLSGQRRTANKIFKGISDIAPGKRKSTATLKKEFKNVFGDHPKGKKYDDFWRVFERLKENKKILGSDLNLKYRVMERITQIMEFNRSAGVEDLTTKITREFDKIYKQEQKRKKKNQPSDIFELPEE